MGVGSMSGLQVVGSRIHWVRAIGNGERLLFTCVPNLPDPYTPPSMPRIPQSHIGRKHFSTYDRARIQTRKSVEPECLVGCSKWPLSRAAASEEAKRYIPSFA